MDIAQARDHIAALDAAAAHRLVPFLADRRMHWRIFGQGDPLMLIHGGHGSWLHWIRNIDALAQHHTVLVPNLPGYGDSHDAAEDGAFQKTVDAVAASLDSLLGGRILVDVAGFSFGGAVAARLAVKRGSVRRLALLGSAASGTPRRERVPLIRWRKADAASQEAALRHNLLAHMLHDPASADELAFAVYKDAVTRTRFRSRGIAGSMTLEKTLAPFTGPALFIWGEHDVTATPELARPGLVNGTPNRDCHLVPAGGHWIQFERADVVNPLLTRWFATA